ncbi:MAG: PEGA domain-containing protein [Aquificae bacterium]|nr:PEGA domain-containing protein [Aquificota bacterium]
MKKFFTLFGLFIFSVFLVACEGKGQLVIKEPPNAKVYINGKYVGTTPIKLTLKEGRYKVTVATSEFDEDTKIVQIFFDRTVELTFNPKPKGILEADSKPQGAKVIDGKEILGKTPLRVKLDPGEHILVFKYGSLGASRKVKIEYRKVTKLFVNLEKAVVHFYLDPEDAELYIDNKPIKAPATLELDEGEHIAIVKKGVYEDKFKFYVKKGEEKKITYKLMDVQLPPIQAYAPIEFTKDYKFLVSLGKGGIYFWDLEELKPHISVYDPQDVRNFDKFINFDVSDDKKLIVGVKPIKALKYLLEDKNKPATKILLWNALTLSPTFSQIFYYEIVGASVNKTKDRVFMITKNGDLLKLNITDNQISSVPLDNVPLTDIKRLEDKIYISSSSGKVVVIDSTSGDVLSSKEVHESTINRLEISKDGKYIITASNDGKVNLLDRDINIVKSFDIGKPVYAANISISDDALAYSVGKIVKVINISDLSQLYQIDDLNAKVIDIEFWTEDIIITGSGLEKPEVKLWNKGHLLRKWVQTIE